MDLARAIQNITNEMVLKLASTAFNKRDAGLVMAGGGYSTVWLTEKYWKRNM
ncbi:MAG: hypothetical protein U0T82_13575 [Bacteroidales bacterium]